MLPRQGPSPNKHILSANRRFPETDAGPSLRYRQPAPPERRHSPPRLDTYRDRDRNYSPRYPSEWAERRGEVRRAAPLYEKRESPTSRGGDRGPHDYGSQPNDKWCRYCKNRGHEIEECRKRQYNNSRLNEPGNGRDPPRRSDAARADPPRSTRPVNVVETAEEASGSQS
ncbi:hypothetical protein P5V15_015467 [Pogonomyrmex californicus]